MAKPWIHAQSSAKRFGGMPKDYEEIHSFMDSSKGAIADSRHRAITHTAFFLSTILERIKFSNSCEATGDNRFPTIINSNGKHISVRDIGEQHILEDFGMKYIPTAQDYLENMEFQDWMNNGTKGSPSSFKKIAAKKKVVEIRID